MNQINSNQPKVTTPLPREGLGGGSSCCGQHAVCEKELLMKGATEPFVYFDDEELDRFRGREADSYTAEEEDEFREVLFTMFTREVADWLQSLQQRGIELPSGVKDEALMLVSEQRWGTA